MLSAPTSVQDIKRRRKVLVAQVGAVHIIVSHSLQNGREQLEVGISIILFRAVDRRKINLRADEKVQAENGQKRAIKETTFHKSLIKLCAQ